MDWKKILPLVAVVGVVLYLIAKLSKNNSGPSVYNALVPSGSPTVQPSRDSARVAAFGQLGTLGLGQLKLAEQGAELNSQIQLAKDRFQYNLQALGLQNEGAFQRLQAELADRNYDRELQQRALDQTFALAQSGQLGQQAGSLINSLLSALRGSQQGSRSGGSTAGSGTQSPGQVRRTVPQMSQAALNRLRQNALWQAIFGGPDPTGSGPIGIRPDVWPEFSAPGDFFYPSNYDLGGVQDTLDWWAGLTSPSGYVTSSFDFIDPWYAPSFDRSAPVYQPTNDEWDQIWYNDYGWLYGDS